METKSKILCLESKVCWGVLILAYSACLALMIITLTSESWYFSEALELKGSLTEVTDGHFEQESYKDLVTNYCETNNSSHCKMFSNLETAGYLYISLETLSIVTTCFWLVTMLIFFLKKKLLWANFVWSSLSCLGHCIAFLSVLILANIQNDCGDFPDNSQPKLCWDSALELSFAVCFVVVFLWFCFGVSAVVAIQDEKAKKFESEVNSIFPMNQDENNFYMPTAFDKVEES